jgi:hypothetical protein
MTERNSLASLGCCRMRVCYEGLIGKEGSHVTMCPDDYRDG